MSYDIIETGRMVVDIPDDQLTQPQPPFKLLPVKQLIDNPVPLKWAIKGILEKGGMNLMSGAYGSGKSFVAFDIAFCVTTGLDWHGHAVTQSPVVILCGEGHSGIADRFAALALEYDVECPECLYISEIPAQLTNSVNAEWVADAVNKRCPDAGMVIVDTLNRNFGGLGCVLN
ncbi:MAG: AAA family ATPase [Methylovulum sp.]